MIANAARPHYPFPTAVVGGQHNAARACNNHTRTIIDVEAVERCVVLTFLLFPVKTAVVRRQHYAVRTDSPAAFLIRSKPDGADGIALWQGILPLPATFRILRVRQRDKEDTDEKQDFHSELDGETELLTTKAPGHKLRSRVMTGVVKARPCRPRLQRPAKSTLRPVRLRQCGAQPCQPPLAADARRVRVSIPSELCV